LCRAQTLVFVALLRLSDVLAFAAKLIDLVLPILAGGILALFINVPMTGLEKRLKIDIPGTGIAFVIPVSSIGGKKQLQFLTEGRGFEKGEESTLKDTKYELLVVVANQGYTEYIMEAAHSANAAGGTVIHAKGTGMQKAEQFLGFSLATEKEMILIVVKNCDKNAIMKAIMEKAGLESKAKSIVFSLPVTETAGMRLVEDE
jgi:nitrogen regulatory protein PII